MTDRNARRRRAIGTAIAYGSTGVVLALVLWLLVSVNALAGSIREQQKGNARSIELIEDCTTKGGECYEDGARRTANVIQVLNEAGDQRRDFIIAVVICADLPGTQTVASIRACADRKAPQ